MQRRGLPGDYLTRNNRFAQLLMQQQGSNNGSTAGGIGEIIRQGLAGYLMGKDSRDQTEAMEAYTKGAMTKPWVNPDTGTASVPQQMGQGMQGPPRMVPTGPAGGMEGALSAVSGLGGNEYAGRLTQQLLMQKMGQQQAEQQRQQQLADAKDLYQFQQQNKAQPVPKEELLYLRAQQDPGFAEFLKSTGSSNTPAAVQEYQFFSQLPPDQQSQFLTVKRANPYLNRGDALVQMNPAAPGQVQASLPKGLPPERTIKDGMVVTMPSVSAEQFGGVPVPQSAGSGQPGMPPQQAPGGISAVPLPRSPEDLAKEQQAKETLARASDVVLEDIDRALNVMDTSSLPVAGFGGASASAIPGTGAADFKALVETVKGNIGFDRLQQMRDSSPTGGALGAINKTELETLQSVLGNLQQSQSEDQLRYNLNRLKNQYLDIVHGKGKGPGRVPTSGAQPGADNDPLGLFK